MPERPASIRGQPARLTADGTSVTLIETLRSMEYDGLVSRTEYQANPPHVEYALTELGRSLLVPLRAVREWAERHVPDIERAHRTAGSVDGRATGSR